jgi:hypothetical protein
MLFHKLLGVEVTLYPRTNRPFASFEVYCQILKFPNVFAFVIIFQEQKAFSKKFDLCSDQHRY